MKPVRYISELTQDSLADLLDDVLYSELRDYIEAANCEYVVEVSSDLVPTIKFECNSDMTIVVETRSIEDKAGISGWEFIPTISCPAVTIQIDRITQNDAESKFNEWAAIASLAEALYRIDFYPDYYLD